MKEYICPLYTALPTIIHIWIIKQFSLHRIEKPAEDDMGICHDREIIQNALDESVSGHFSHDI